MSASGQAAAPPPVTVGAEARALSRQRPRLGDLTFRALVSGSGALIVAIFLAIGIFILDEAWPAISHYGIGSFLSGSRWAPSEAALNLEGKNPYGILQFVYGTVLTSAIALLLAVPIAVGLALYITEIAPSLIRRPLAYVIDILASVPSVVYGFWGIFALIPAVKPVANDLSDWLHSIPVVGPIFAGPFFGPSYFVAALVLAIMVLPIVTAICREVFAVAPLAEKEAALALGTTRWEMIKLAILKRSRVGIFGAAILGLGRAFGETIAVTMVIGNSVLGITTSIFGQGATMPSVIANEFTEATEPFHLDSLFVVALCLLVVSLIVNTAGKLIISRVGTRIA